MQDKSTKLEIEVVDHHKKRGLDWKEFKLLLRKYYLFILIIALIPLVLYSLGQQLANFGSAAPLLKLPDKGQLGTQRIFLYTENCGFHNQICCNPATPNSDYYTDDDDNKCDDNNNLGCYEGFCKKLEEVCGALGEPCCLMTKVTHGVNSFIAYCTGSTLGCGSTTVISEDNPWKSGYCEEKNPSCGGNGQLCCNSVGNDRGCGDFSCISSAYDNTEERCGEGVLYLEVPEQHNDMEYNVDLNEFFQVELFTNVIGVDYEYHVQCGVNGDEYVETTGNKKFNHNCVFKTRPEDGKDVVKAWVQVWEKTGGKSRIFFAKNMSITINPPEPTEAPLNNPVYTLTPAPPTKTPAPTKAPNGTKCTTSSQCVSWNCKSCPGDTQKYCRPYGYSCPE